MIRAKDISALDPKKFIIIKGAAVNNLKKVDVAFPRNQFIVITGLSGSGKSSLAFDTLYAEGQRRYVESLSAYARQFIGRMDKPEVDYIKGIAPAIAIEQKVNTRNPRSTVGTSTEIYDYLKLLFARIGKTYSPVSGKIIREHNVSDVVDFILSLPAGTMAMIAHPLLIHSGRTLNDELRSLMQKGFMRIEKDGEVKRLDEIVFSTSQEKKKAMPAGRQKKAGKKKVEQVSITVQEGWFVIVDRVTVAKELTEEDKSRIADSVQTAFNEGMGTCKVIRKNEKEAREEKTFSNRFEADGITFEKPSPHLFSFNNPYGACKRCEGFGSIIGIDEELVIPDKSLSVYEGAIQCWKGEKMKEWNQELIMTAYKFDFPIHKPVAELNDYQKKLLWTGNKYFKGINAFFSYVEEQSYKIQYRVMLSRYRGKTICPECRGTRLRADAAYVKVAEKSITDVVLMPASESFSFFKNLSLNKHDEVIAKRLKAEIINRLGFLCDVGLGYLTLNRLSNTLSGGESQRINLATALGTTLVGSMYILDEPSIGLHPRDTHRLIEVLKKLQQAGNTLIVVEHDEEIMKAADRIIDLGPEAGTHGGEVVFEGTWEDMERKIKKNHFDSHTANYLLGRDFIAIPGLRRKWRSHIEVKGARENNLKGFNVKFPLGIITCITGVSGSGKSSLVKKILYPSIKKILGGYSDSAGSHDKITGDVSHLKSIEFIDQNPIGKSSRSNPVTYVKAYDDIRALFAELPASKARGLKPSHFSFNVDGGRCDMCQGEGFATIEMQFMADIHLKCEACGGKRFKEDTLAVSYREKNIHDVLDMTIDEALKFFDLSILSKFIPLHEKISDKLKPLADVGCGYLKLGQSSSTLSGGEAQRIKLASFLGKGRGENGILFIFDEPTTGLHFHDIKKLLFAFNALVEQGNTVIVIEHNPDVIKCADWIIDLGPEGGEQGGYLVFEGTPDDIIREEKSYTGKFLRDKLN